MRTWYFAHRQARIGEWEILARDRVRFNDRINKLETIISSVLSREHRNKIFSLIKFWIITSGFTRACLYEDLTALKLIVD